MLAWHVDYWDYLGWKDPYAAPAYTARQKRYRATRELKFFGTPQLFVNNTNTRGRDGFKAAVARESKKKARLKIQATATRKQDKITATVKLEKLDPKLELSKNVAVIPILFQRTVKTKCTAGENKGKTLEEYFIVRQMLAPQPANAVARAEGVLARFQAPKGVKAADLGVAILVEDRVRMATLDCLAVPVR